MGEFTNPNQNGIPLNGFDHSPAILCRSLASHAELAPSKQRLKMAWEPRVASVQRSDGGSRSLDATWILLKQLLSFPTQKPKQVDPFKLSGSSGSANRSNLKSCSLIYLRHLKKGACLTMLHTVNTPNKNQSWERSTIQKLRPIQQWPRLCARQPNYFDLRGRCSSMSRRRLLADLTRLGSLNFKDPRRSGRNSALHGYCSRSIWSVHNAWSIAEKDCESSSNRILKYKLDKESGKECNTSCQQKSGQPNTIRRH